MEENKTPEELQDTALDQVAGGVGAVMDDSGDEPVSLGRSGSGTGRQHQREHYDVPGKKPKDKKVPDRRRKHY